MTISGRQVDPDIMHESPLVSKLINYVMQDGNKNRAMKIVYKAFELLEEREGDPGQEVFEKAIENVKPKLETRSRRVGGANYQVPYEVPPDRSTALALRWLVKAASKRSQNRMEERLASEIVSASHKEGEAFQQKLDSHRRAEANKAFAHYRW
ncbi:MAG: 30S ribosomal protein S7 [Candidatus Bipolaricaulota bacterium]